MNSGCSLGATDRLFPSIRYFSDAYRFAIDYPAPVTIGYELMSPILCLLKLAKLAEPASIWRRIFTPD